MSKKVKSPSLYEIVQAFLYRGLQLITYMNQSIVKRRATSSVGSPAAVSTISIVTRPALGTVAAPILAKIAVRLQIIYGSFTIEMVIYERKSYFMSSYGVRIVNFLPEECCN